MTKTELNEVFKIIDEQIAFADKELKEACDFVDKYHYRGKKEVLTEVKDILKKRFTNI